MYCTAIPGNAMREQEVQSNILGVECCICVFVYLCIGVLVYWCICVCVLMFLCLCIDVFVFVYWCICVFVYWCICIPGGKQYAGCAVQVWNVVAHAEC